MKIITSFIITVLLCANLTAQTYTSVTNGNWTSPTTWTPTGVPTPGNNVVINHDVILNTDFGNITGTITINNGASLTEDIAGRNFMINGGRLFIDGTMDISNFSLQAGLLEITGTFNASLIYSSDSTENYGTINVDSLQNDGFINNYANGVVNALAILNNIEIYNAGIINVTNYLNNGDFINDNELYVTNFTSAFWTINNNYIEFDDFTNSGDFQNNGAIYGFFGFTNTGYFEHYGDFTVENDFLNADSTNNEAYFYTESLVVVGNNWYNADTIEGITGAQFCITNNTGNSGILIGAFDICDDTPPSTSPYIDLNTGTVDSAVTYCITPCNVSADKSVITDNAIGIYPNPVSSTAYIEINNRFSGNIELSVYNLLGKKVLSSIKYNAQKFVINAKNLDNGLYFYTIGNGTEKTVSGKFIIKK